MIVSLNELTLPPPMADICVIGAGAAGIAIAREFVGTQHSVILLEAGGNSFEERNQEPYRSEVVGLSHGGIHTGRARVVGGTTTLWAGQTLPLFDIDFKFRDWIPHSGWPITRGDLKDFYPRAERVLQVPHVSYDRTMWPTDESRPPDYYSDLVVTYYSQFTAVPDFSRKYRQELFAAPNIHLISEANVVGLEANAQATAIDHVRVKSFAGNEQMIRAKMFIVCCGGIETARLLLASNSVEPAGIGNQHDVVGRYFQDHPGVTMPVRVMDRKKFGRWYNSFRKENIRHSIKLAASETLQREQKTLNVGAEVFYPPEQEDPIAAAKVVLKSVRNKHLRPQVPAAIGSILRRPHKVVKAAFRHYVLKQVASVDSGIPHIGFSVEQLPNPLSRVMLSEQIDSLGMRRTALDWRVTEVEGHSIGVFAEAVAAEWRRLKVADFDPQELNLAGRERGEHGGYIDASHHIGTTRMGNDPATSVVNSNCQVHHYDNLYIGSSSVFPTGGFSNPTLTMLALCMRICDQIKSRISDPVLETV